MQENNVNNQQTNVIPLGQMPDKNALACPHCGLTDLTVDEETGHYTCNACQYEFKPVNDKFKQLPKINDDRQVDTSNLITLKCAYCHTEVTIDKKYLGQIKCHWCRCTLDANNQVQTTTPPRALLPFKVTREEAKIEIDKYLKDRNIFALTDFKKRLYPSNVICTYLPYVLINTTTHAKLIGQGEHTVKKNYDVNAGVTTYDADDYQVSREYDFYIDGLLIENEKETQNKKNTDSIKNMINNIKPFDVENSIPYKPDYLGGCTSQNRNINYTELKPIAELRTKNLTKFAANETLEEYDRGVAWTEANLEVKQEDWKIVYLPVWLYGYKLKNDDTFYYIAVNGRNKNTTGNIPIDMKKLITISIASELIGIILMLVLSNFDLKFLFLLLGPICFYLIKQRYNKLFNMSTEEDEEIKPKTYIYNLIQEDKLMQRKSGLKTTHMVGANNTDPIGTDTEVIRTERDRTGESNKEFTKQK